MWRNTIQSKNRKLSYRKSHDSQKHIKAKKLAVMESILNTYSTCLFAKRGTTSTVLEVRGQFFGEKEDKCWFWKGEKKVFSVVGSNIFLDLGNVKC